MHSGNLGVRFAEPEIVTGGRRVDVAARAENERRCADRAV